MIVLTIDLASISENGEDLLLAEALTGNDTDAVLAAEQALTRAVEQTTGRNLEIQIDIGPELTELHRARTTVGA